MSERDGIARAHPQAAAASEVVDRARYDPEAHAIQFPKERRDLARQRPVDKGLEKDRLGSVLALVHCDELGEHGIRVLAARTPAFDAPDQAFGAPAERRVDEALFRWRMQVHGAWSHVGAARDLAHAQIRVAAARHFA